MYLISNLDPLLYYKNNEKKSILHLLKWIKI
jgi:hypothetical protein